MEIKTLQDIIDFAKENNFVLQENKVAKRGTCSCKGLKEKVYDIKIPCGLNNSMIFASIYSEDPIAIRFGHFAGAYGRPQDFSKDEEGLIKKINELMPTILNLIPSQIN